MNHLFLFSCFFLFVAISSEAQDRLLNLKENTINALYYKNSKKENDYLIKYIILTDTNIYVYDGFPIFTNDSTRNEMKKGYGILKQIDKILLKKGFYFEDAVFDDSFNKVSLIKITNIDTFRLGKTQIWSISNNKRALLIDFAMEKEKSNDKKHIVVTSKSKYQNIKLIENKLTSDGQIFHLAYDDLDVIDEEYEYWFLKEFWIVRYNFGYLDDFFLVQYDSQKVTFDNL